MNAASAAIAQMPSAMLPTVNGMPVEPGGATAANSAGSSAVIVVPNGVDRPPAVIPSDVLGRELFEGRPFMFMVGSAYRPNIDGFCNYVVKDGAFMVPPVKSIAVCGGVADGILKRAKCPVLIVPLHDQTT